MNKKIILSIIIVVATLPVFATSILTPDADKIGKEFATNNPGVTIVTSTLEEKISEQEVNRA